jgi:hypothetical protein
MSPISTEKCNLKEDSLILTARNSTFSGSPPISKSGDHFKVAWDLAGHSGGIRVGVSPKGLRSLGDWLCSWQNIDCYDSCTKSDRARVCWQKSNQAPPHSDLEMLKKLVVGGEGELSQDS